MNYLEIAGVITGILGVFLTAKAFIWCWPVAILNVLIYFYIFFQEQLFSDAGLQIFYLGMAIFGWYHWRKRKDPKKDIQITHSKFSEFLWFFPTAILIALVQGFLLKKYTHASFPYLDSFCTAGSLVATFLQAKKKIENWILWIFIDLIYIYIFIQKNLYPTAILYFIFVVLAGYGFIEWKKQKAIILKT